MKTISVHDGLCHLNNSDFKNENEFTDDLIPKLSSIIKDMYHLDMCAYKKEVVFMGVRNGMKFGIRPDIVIKTRQDITVIVECKNLKNGNKKSTFDAISQMMHYKFFFDIGQPEMKYKMILATNHLEFELIQFMGYYGINFIDVIINKKGKSGHWINEVKNIQPHD